jgi:hypothetical protein
MTKNIITNSLNWIYKIRLLIRHFILRYINNEVLLFDTLRRINLIALLSLLAVSIGFFSHLLLRLYLFGLKPDMQTLWLEKTYFLTVSMALVGIVYTIMWDNLSLDRKDYNNLLICPLKPRDLFVSKGLSALVLVVLTTLTFNILSTFIFSFYLRHGLPINPVIFGLIHLLTHFLAYLFLFFLIAGIQSSVRSLSKPKWYGKISTIIQILFFILFISLLFWFPYMYPLLSSLKTESSVFIYAFPPMWFVGMGEYMLGRSDSVFSVYPSIILIAFSIPVGFYLLGMPRYFRRFLRTRIKTSRSVKLSGFKSMLKRNFNTLVLRQPAVRASYYFSRKTLNRCRKHKMHLLMYWIIPLSLIFVGLVALYVKYEATFLSTTNLFLISVPIILLFFLCWGIRTVITHPVSQKANWIFSLKSFQDPWQVTRGLKRAFIFSIVLPLMGTVFVVYFTLWGFLPALGHVTYCTTAAFLVINILFANYRKLPFVSPQQNHKSNHRIFKTFLLVLFVFFIYVFSWLGKFLIENPEFYILYYLSISILFFMLQWIQSYLQKELVFSYNPILERVIVRLQVDTSAKKLDLY